MGFKANAGKGLKQRRCPCPNLKMDTELDTGRGGKTEESEMSQNEKSFRINDSKGFSKIC